MNAKKAKLLRKTLKTSDVNWKEANHVQRIHKDHEGNEHRAFTIFLDPKCGRSIYRRSKKLAIVREL